MAELNGRRIGLIGLGLMGRPMARNLKAAGAEVVVHSRSPGPVEEMVAEGMVDGGSPAGVTREAEAVILMLTDTPAVEKVLTGAGGVFEALEAGKLVIDMGTTKVLATREFAKAAEAKGAMYVDAPVSGGTVGAERAALTIMAGGGDDAVARAMPILEALGARITHVGGSGDGQVAKAANQVIVGLNIGAVAEALALARRAGADPARVREALKGGFADSRVLELHGQRMIDGAFEPGGKCTTQRKDMDQAVELAEHLGLELPATRLSRDLYDRLIAEGLGDLDHSALIKAIDR